jgi:hypothetical protein
MATTLTIQNSINFVQPILKNTPLMVSNFEPALTAANIILSTILGPPFRWRFNRATITQAITSGGGTDYVKSVPDFGFLETQWLTDGQGGIFQLGGAVALAKASGTSRPTRMSVEFDDNAGNLTFRFSDIPDVNYTMNADYQKKAPLLTSPAQALGVVPDEFAHIFNKGFLAWMMLLNNDSRFPIFENYFVSSLLSAQDGLSDQERSIFLADWMRLSQTLVRAQGAVNSGVAGRAK